MFSAVRFCGTTQCTQLRTMEELFNILSSSARLQKKNKRPRQVAANGSHNIKSDNDDDEQHTEEANDDHAVGSDNDNDDYYDDADLEPTNPKERSKSRDRTGKRDTSQSKQELIHKEQVAAFRRSMGIRLSAQSKHDPTIPDPISSFAEIMRVEAKLPSMSSFSSKPRMASWWNTEEHVKESMAFSGSVLRVILNNIEGGRWKEPTPIQMQSIPALLERRDVIGAAPTGSGKSGAFILPIILLSRVPFHVFYRAPDEPEHVSSRATAGNKKKQEKAKPERAGEIRSLLLAPSLELAAQLHREVERLSLGLPGSGRSSSSSLLLSKANAAQVIAGTIGGKHGLDVLVSTPLRLLDCIEKGLKLNSVRVIVLDEADRLLDASDETRKAHRVVDEHASDCDESDEDDFASGASGSAQTKSFLAQIDAILAQVPITAVRALFSATVTPMVRLLSESILRNPVDISIQTSASPGGANPDIQQELVFVGREEGKLLAIRQLVQRGELRPPVIMFLQSQERAQALFGELLYDGIHVDVIHAGRSKAAREKAVAKFRRGDTWVLICTDLVARGVDFRAVNMVINYDLPESGITYVHRIGRTGRAGRKGRAITLFTEADFENLRTIANIMKQSGCRVEEWMLNLERKKGKAKAPRRAQIDTTARYDKVKRKRKRQMIEQSKKQHAKAET